jgi:glutamate synthase (NADPH/NADH) small chain
VANAALVRGFGRSASSSTYAATSAVDLDRRGEVSANMVDGQTSRPKMFAAGDMRRGQSRVLRAIREGQLCAQAIDKF